MRHLHDIDHYHILELFSGIYDIFILCSSLDIRNENRVLECLP